MFFLSVSKTFFYRYTLQPRYIAVVGSHRTYAAIGESRYHEVFYDAANGKAAVTKKTYFNDILLQTILQWRFTAFLLLFAMSLGFRYKRVR